MQFTYTFPPLLALGLTIQRDAVREDEGFDLSTGITTRHDNGAKRWMRGFMAKRWYVKLFNAVIAVGALVTAGLGMYSSIEGNAASSRLPAAMALSRVSPVSGSRQPR